MISIKAIFVSAALCLYPIMALSEAPSLQGEDEANFKEAVQAWLNGEDLPALQSLSDQAQQGNAAAQILLASIASRSSFHAHVTSGMARKDRIALLRKPGGLSGKSWLTEAQNSEPLALALLQSARVGEKAPAIATLVEMGEPQTALLAAESMLRHGEADELVSVLQGLDEKLPKEADILLIWAAYQASQEADGEYSGSAGIARTLSTDDTFRLSEFAWGHLSPRDVWENQEVRDAAIAASDKVRYWSTVRRFCKDVCSPDVDYCTATGASFLIGPFAIRSPLESVIPSDVYWNSQRAIGDLARSTQDLSWLKGEPVERLDQCYLKEMQELQLKQGHG